MHVAHHAGRGAPLEQPSLGAQEGVREPAHRVEREPVDEHADLGLGRVEVLAQPLGDVFGATRSPAGARRRRRCMSGDRRPDALGEAGIRGAALHEPLERRVLVEAAHHDRVLDRRGVVRVGEHQVCRRARRRPARRGRRPGRSAR